jgi:hypothetical protein
MAGADLAGMQTRHPGEQAAQPAVPAGSAHSSDIYTAGRSLPAFEELRIEC